MEVPNLHEIRTREPLERPHGRTGMHCCVQEEPLSPLQEDFRALRRAMLQKGVRRHTHQCFRKGRGTQDHVALSRG